MLFKEFAIEFAPFNNEGPLFNDKNVSGNYFKECLWIFGNWVIKSSSLSGSSNSYNSSICGIYKDWALLIGFPFFALVGLLYSI